MLVEWVDACSMNRTSRHTIAFSLGLLATLGGASLAQNADDPRVRVIWPPEEAGAVANFFFSGDASVVVAQGSMDNQSVGLIVTLPELGDVLWDAQRDGYIRSKLGR